MLHKHFIKNQKGQAILEYTLLLTISLIVLGGIIYQFNTAFKVYLDAWFLDRDESYLACIIKNGIIPGEGSGGECQLPRFDIKNGKVLAGANGAGGGSGKNPASSSGGKGTNAPGANGGGGGRSGDGRSRGGIPYNSADAKNAGINSAAAKETKANTGNTGFSSTKGGIAAGSEGGSGSQESLAFGGGRRGKTQSENMDEKSSTNVPLNDRDMKSAREIAAEKSKKKQAALENEFELSFGNVFKYLIIAILIFSLIFFVGSQFLAVARSKKRK